jgi:hypothetical protein
MLFANANEQHVLRVPYRTQLDGSPYAAANCGPTALSMLLAYYDIDASPGDLRIKAMQAQHSWIDDEGGYSDRYGVFVYNLATVAEEFGVHANGLWIRESSHKVDRLREWRVEDVRRQVLVDRPVILEVRYRALPAHLGVRAAADHYIVVHGVNGDGFVYSDPLSRDDEGANLEISADDLERAMSEAEIPNVGFAGVKTANN